MNIIGTIWGSPLRQLTTTATAIAAVAGAIVAVPPAWSAMGLPEVASKGYVHMEVDPVKMAQDETARAVYQLSLAQLQSSLYAAQQDAQKAPSETVTERIQYLQQQIQMVQSKLNTEKQP